MSKKLPPGLLPQRLSDRAAQIAGARLELERLEQGGAWVLLHMMPGGDAGMIACGTMRETHDLICSGLAGLRHVAAGQGEERAVAVLDAALAALGVNGPGVSGHTTPLREGDGT
jgi:hypothetical protein